MKSRNASGLGRRRGVSLPGWMPPSWILSPNQPAHQPMVSMGESAAQTKMPTMMTPM
jgi:hypothetical protein